MKRILIILLALILFAMCISCGKVPSENGEGNLTSGDGQDTSDKSGGDAAKSSDEFTFSLTWNTYGVSSYDSESGKLVKTTDATHPEDYVTTFFMTEEQLDSVSRIIRELDVESYPDEYNPNENAISRPPMTLILSVHTDTVDKTITAKNIAITYGAKDEKGQKFLSACKDIIDIIVSSDEWKSLPDYEVLYE
ncbi:MAG: hypothetical protein E7672_00385 [Ruminococcaceae bacterium]|nr:hypothetical protein [Oscillospiraceae bacterium]